MNQNILWSLRLGYSSKQAISIEKGGIIDFLSQSFIYKNDEPNPSFLTKIPITIGEIDEYSNQLSKASTEERLILNKKHDEIALQMKTWWIDLMVKSEFPLREKMTCFWHNHFVAPCQAIKVFYWTYQHNHILRQNAFGNFKSITKDILKTNAIIKYLDNGGNRKTKLNENLSRELLELFTLGIGNYTEKDVKNGAKGLAGLTVTSSGGQYHSEWEVVEVFEYLGKKGVLRVDDMVDAIFDQPNIPYLLTRKLLKWFIYDTPDESLVIYYGDYFREVNFEIQPLLIKIFSEEFSKNTAGSKIKDPLLFYLQLMQDITQQVPNSRLVAEFCSDQGMNLYNQTNVKGWEGGTSWLNTQNYLQRQNIIDILCTGKNFTNRKLNLFELEILNLIKSDKLKLKLFWTKDQKNTQIISHLTQLFLFNVDQNMQADLESILKYDFDGNTESANFAILRLLDYILKTPEFQLL